MKRYTCCHEAIVLAINIGDCECNVSDTLIGDRPIRIVVLWGRTCKLEQLDVHGPQFQHHSPTFHAGKSGYGIVPLVQHSVSYHLHADSVSIERKGSVKARYRYANVINAGDRHSGFH